MKLSQSNTSKFLFKWLLFLGCFAWILLATVATLSHILSDTVFTNASGRSTTPTSISQAPASSSTPSFTTPFRSTSLRQQSVASSSHLQSHHTFPQTVPTIAPVSHLSSSATVSTYGGALSSRHPITRSLRKPSQLPLAHITVPSIAAPQTSLAHNAISHPLQPTMRRASGTPTPVGWFDIGGHIYGYDINGDIIVDGTGTPILYDDEYDRISGTLITQGEAVDNPIGSAWIMILFAFMYATYVYIRKKKSFAR